MRCLVTSKMGEPVSSGLRPGTNSPQPKASTSSFRSPSTSVLAFAVAFPAVPVGAPPPAVVPLSVAPPVALVTTPGLEAKADSFCNKPKLFTVLTAA